MAVWSERGPGQARGLIHFQATKLYDLLAAMPLIIWYGLCVTARFPALAQEIAAVDLTTVDLMSISGLVSKLASLVFISALIALLTFRDTPQAKAPGLMPRVAALAGTYLGGGTVLALYSVLKLGRSLSMMSEARRLVTRGPYAVIRHPLYLGEGIALAGLTLQFLSPWAVLILALQCACQIERMNNEERVLSRVFPEYRAYMAHTAR